jgi:antirestriction protein ArdC
MPKNKSNKSKVQATDKYQLITDQICSLLEQDLPPWKKPWKGASNYPFQNLITGHEYTGSNPLWCLVSNMYHGYDSPYFITFNQAKEQKWTVKKGAKSTWIRFAGTAVKEGENEQGEKVDYQIGFAKWSNIFSTDCIDDLDGKKKITDFIQETTNTVPDNSDDKIVTIDRFIESTKAVIEHGGNRACYSPLTDTIKVPEFVRFSSAEKYYATTLHELGHWTGASTRLDREGISHGDFGSEVYAFEELIAELTSAFVGNRLFPDYLTQDLEHHASYLDSWLQVLRKDNKAFFRAVSAAQKASDYLLGFAS